MLSYLPLHSEVRKHQQYDLIQKLNKPTSKSYHNPDHNNLFFCSQNQPLAPPLLPCNLMTGSNNFKNVNKSLAWFHTLRTPPTSSSLAKTDVWFVSTSRKSSDTSSLFQKQTYFEGREGSASPIAVCRLRGATGE